MKEETSIILTDEGNGGIPFNTENRNEWLCTAILKNNKAIHDLLVGYHYAEAGQVCNILLKDESVNFKSDLSGSFSVGYETHYFMACSDNRYEMENSMILDFYIDFNTKRIVLSGEEILERAPDGY